MSNSSPLILALLFWCVLMVVNVNTSAVSPDVPAAEPGVATEVVEPIVSTWVQDSVEAWLPCYTDALGLDEWIIVTNYKALNDSLVAEVELTLNNTYFSGADTAWADITFYVDSYLSHADSVEQWRATLMHELLHAVEASVDLEYYGIVDDEVMDAFIRKLELTPFVLRGELCDGS